MLVAVNKESKRKRKRELIVVLLENHTHTHTHTHTQNLVLYHTMLPKKSYPLNNNNDDIDTVVFELKRYLIHFTS